MISIPDSYLVRKRLSPFRFLSIPGVGYHPVLLVGNDVHFSMYTGNSQVIDHILATFFKWLTLTVEKEILRIHTVTCNLANGMNSWFCQKTFFDYNYSPLNLVRVEASNLCFHFSFAEILLLPPALIY